jgi:hypothetical protein
MAQADDPGPGVSSRGFPSPESPPPFARGPSPAATAAKPIPPPADTRLPPALTLVPRRTATRRLSSPDARTRRLVRRNVGGLPANSVPLHPPPPPKPLHSAIRPPLPRPSAGPFAPEWVYAVRRSVYPGRQAPSRSRVGSHCFRSGGCPLRHTLQTPFQVSRLAKQVHASVSVGSPHRTASQAKRRQGSWAGRWGPGQGGRFPPR